MQSIVPGTDSIKKMKRNIVNTILFILGVIFSINAVGSKYNIPQVKASIKKAVALIPATPPRRKIIEGHNLHWKHTGAFTSFQTVKPELYGSYFNGELYSWKKGQRGKLQARIDELRTLATDTMITWGKKVSGQPLVNLVGHTTVEAVTGCGYYNSKLAGWETGTIYDYKGKKEMKFAHVWNISPFGRLFMWETLCPAGVNVTKCQTELEKEIPSHSDGKLVINMIIAEPSDKGVTRYIRHPIWYH